MVYTDLCLHNTRSLSPHVSNYFIQAEMRCQFLKTNVQTHHSAMYIIITKNKATSCNDARPLMTGSEIVKCIVHVNIDHYQRRHLRMPAKGLEWLTLKMHLTAIVNTSMRINTRLPMCHIGSILLS